MLGNGLDIGSNYGIYILVGKTQINEVFCLTKWWYMQWRKIKKKNKARAVGRAVTGGYNFKLSGYHWGEVRDTVGKGFPNSGSSRCEGPEDVCMSGMCEETWGPGLVGESRMGRAVRGKVMGVKGMEVGVRLCRSRVCAKSLQFCRGIL